MFGARNSQSLTMLPMLPTHCNIYDIPLCVLPKLQSVSGFAGLKGRQKGKLIIEHVNTIRSLHGLEGTTISLATTDCSVGS